jgi:hypothetical protein
MKRQSQLKITDLKLTNSSIQDLSGNESKQIMGGTGYADPNRELIEFLERAEQAGVPIVRVYSSIGW